MRRRAFLHRVAALCGAASFPALAQQPRRRSRVGMFAGQFRRLLQPHLSAFEEGLHEFGYINGANIQLEYRFSEGDMDLLPEMARELVRDKADVLVVGTNPHIAAAKAATQSIPIVMVIGTGVVEAGFVKSLARPGGNITGLTWDIGAEGIAKRIEFLKQVTPALSRLAVLWDPGYPELPGGRQVVEGAASALGIALTWFELQDELDSVVEAMAKDRAGALLTYAGPRIWARRAQLAELSIKHRLPSSHYDSAFADSGGLMSYAPNLPGLYRASAKYVDRILRGARPGDLPVEQPTTLELVVNLRTARALGVAVPRPLLLLADRVIE